MLLAQFHSNTPPTEYRYTSRMNRAQLPDQSGGELMCSFHIWICRYILDSKSGGFHLHIIAFLTLEGYEVFRNRVKATFSFMLFGRCFYLQ